MDGSVSPATSALVIFPVLITFGLLWGVHHRGWPAAPGRPALARPSGQLARRSRQIERAVENLGEEVAQARRLRNQAHPHIGRRVAQRLERARYLADDADGWAQHDLVVRLAVRPPL